MISLDSCSWCHDLNDTSERFCRSCGHEAHKPRTLCDCPVCERPPLPINSDELCWMCGYSAAAHDLDGGCP